MTHLMFLHSSDGCCLCCGLHRKKTLAWMASYKLHFNAFFVLLTGSVTYSHIYPATFAKKWHKPFLNWLSWIWGSLQKASDQSLWKRSESICLHSWLFFRCLLQFSFMLFMSVRLMKWGHSATEQLSGREMREDSSHCLFDVCEPAAAFIVHRLTGQELKNDTIILCLIQADYIIPVVVLVNMRWWEWPLKGY